MNVMLSENRQTKKKKRYVQQDSKIKFKQSESWSFWSREVEVRLVIGSSDTGASGVLLIF
jgi:hypothetical protein